VQRIARGFPFIIIICLASLVSRDSLTRCVKRDSLSPIVSPARPPTTPSCVLPPPPFSGGDMLGHQ
jgi:hypothetical protein